MPKFATAAAGTLSLLLLVSCGSRAPEAPQANAVEAESNGIGTGSAADPAPPGAPANSAAGEVPPPDAVSHPNGYLPPAPAEPEDPAANGSGPDPSGPATEDEYIRNRQ